MTPGTVYGVLRLSACMSILHQPQTCYCFFLAYHWNQLRYRSCCLHDISCVVTAASDNGGENKPRRAHSSAWLYRHRRHKWQQKTTMRVMPNSPRSPETRTTTASNSTGNSDHSTGPVATIYRRSRRDVHRQSMQPRWVSQGSVSTRILTKLDGITHQLARRYGVRLITDRLLQLQHDLETTTTKKLSVDHDCNWSQFAASPLNGYQNSLLTLDRMFMDKKASYRRRAAINANDLSGVLRNVRSEGPPIDPMLLMVGIGRK